MYHKPLAYGIRAPELRRLAERHEELDLKSIKIIIDKVLTTTVRLVFRDVATWITKYVPKMTGRLRRDLYSHLLDSYVRNCVLRIFIQTSINYAKKVNEYTTSQVRHRGKKIKYRGRTITLWDPSAIGHFFDKMVIFALTRIKANLVKSKRKYAASTKLKMRDMYKIIRLW